MQAALLCVLVLTSVPSAWGATAEEASPISKVIELLSSLEAKIMKEGAASQKTYDEFAEWCEDRSKELGFEIKTLESEKEGLEALLLTFESFDLEAKFLGTILAPLRKLVIGFLRGRTL